MRFPLSLALVIALTSCVGPPGSTPAPVAPPRPRPAPAPMPVSPPPSGWQDRPVAAGDWRYRNGASESVAQFGPAAGAAVLTIGCEPGARRIRVARAGAIAGDGGQMTVRTSFGIAQWPARNGGGAEPQVVAIRAADDAALDQIAFSRGRFAVEVPGLPPLVVPAWAEVARVIEDCRS